MLLITVLVATVMLLFLFLNYKNKFIYALSAQIMFVSLMMIVCVIYMSKVTQYKYYMHLDYQIYLWLHTLRMNFNSLTRIYNFCLAMFMITSVIYSKMFYKMHWLTVCILVVPIVLFLVFADRRVGYNIYMSYYSQGGAVSEFLIKNSLKICEIIFEIYLIMPVAFMALSLKKTKIFVKYKYNLVLGICIAIINLFIWNVFEKGLFSDIWITNVDMAKLPVTSTASNGYIIVSLLFVILFATIIFLVFHFKPYGSFAVANSKKTLKLQKCLIKT